MENISKVLVVDDEEDLVFIMSQVLMANDFNVATAYNGEDGLNLYYSFSPDLIIADRMMPGMSGDDMIMSIRRIDSHTPIILLTAKTSSQDILEGFEVGANDYVKKPFSMKELLARVNALLSLSKSQKSHPQVLTVGKFTLDTVSQSLTFGNKPIALTNMEYTVLKLLMENKNHEVPVNSIIMTLWSDGNTYTNSNVQVYISKIRRILSQDPNVKLINLRLIGYKLVEITA